MTFLPLNNWIRRNFNHWFKGKIVQIAKILTLGFHPTNFDSFWPEFLSLPRPFSFQLQPPPFFLFFSFICSSFLHVSAHSGTVHAGTVPAEAAGHFTPPPAATLAQEQPPTVPFQPKTEPKQQQIVVSVVVADRRLASGTPPSILTACRWSTARSRRPESSIGEYKPLNP